MDDFMLQHFSAWLDRWIRPDDQPDVMRAVLDLLRDNPDLIENNYSWPELARMVGKF